TERLHRRPKDTPQALEHFLLGDQTDVRPGSVLVAVRNVTRLDSLERVLDKTDTDRMDIVVLAVQQDLEREHTFTGDIAELFSKVVSCAEKKGKPVDLMVVPGSDPFSAIVQTAARLKSSLVVLGESAKMSDEEMAKQFGDAWERLPTPRPQMSLKVGARYFN